MCLAYGVPGSVSFRQTSMGGQPHERNTLCMRSKCTRVSGFSPLVSANVMTSGRRPAARSAIIIVVESTEAASLATLRSEAKPETMLSI